MIINFILGHLKRAALAAACFMLAVVLGVVVWVLQGFLAGFLVFALFAILAGYLAYRAARKTITEGGKVVNGFLDNPEKVFDDLSFQAGDSLGEVSPFGLRRRKHDPRV